MSLDALDQKILFELDVNSRQTLKQIANKTRSSKEVVAYRIKRLEEKGIIFKYLTVLDTSKLGFFLHKVMFKLENVNIEEKLKIIEYLKNHKNSLWVVECDGPFDVGFMIFARDLHELDRVVSEVSDNLCRNIHERIVSTNISGEYFSRNYLVGNRAIKNQRYGSKKEKLKIDSKDWRILLELVKNSRATMTEITQSVPIKIDAIRERIKKLERLGIISGYSVLLNHEGIGQLHYKVLLYLSDYSAGVLNSIKEFCKQNPNVTYFIKSLGVWDVEIDIEVENPEQYRKIMLGLMENFPKKIKKYDTLQIYKLHQYRYLPDQSLLV